MRKKYNTVEEFISDLKGISLKRIILIKDLISKSFPEAKPVISYNIPCYILNKKRVYFSGYNNHVSIYPILEEIKNDSRFRKYIKGRGTLQFSNDEEFPKEIIEEIIEKMLG